MLTTAPFSHVPQEELESEALHFSLPKAPVDLSSRLTQLVEGRNPKTGRSMGAFERTQELYQFVRESISVNTDFAGIFGATLDRKLEAAYRTNPGPMRQLVRVATGNDFRLRERHVLSGGTALLSKTGRGDAIIEIDKPTSRSFSYKVEGYGKKSTTTWQDIVDDAGDMDLLGRLPDMLAQSAVATEESALCDLFMDASGWLASVFSTATGGVAPLNTALTEANLIAAVANFGTRVTPTDGHPMPIRPSYLVFGPALRMTALKLLSSTEIRTEPGNTGTGTYGTKNVIQALGLTPLELPWMPLKMTSGTIGATAWGIFAKPSELVLPLAEFGLIRGRETPQIYVKQSNAALLSGGQLAPSFGDFDRLGVEWAIRMFFGSVVTGDSRGAVVSNGQ